MQIEQVENGKHHVFLTVQCKGGKYKRMDSAWNKKTEQMGSYIPQTRSWRVQEQVGSISVEFCATKPLPTDPYLPPTRKAVIRRVWQKDTLPNGRRSL